MIKKAVKLTKTFVEIMKGVYYTIQTLRLGKREKFIQEPEKSVLIMGNGPSLKNTDIDKILECDPYVCCVNFFPAKDERFMKIKPQFLCLFDPIFFKDAPASEEKKKELFDVLEKVDWPLKIVCTQGHELPVKNSYISYAHIAGYPFVGNGLERMRHFLYRKNLTNAGLQNVMIGAGYYFISKKVKEIYLTGLDMSEFKMLYVGEDNEVYLATQHHYGSEKIKHSDLGIIKKGEFYKLLGCYVTMFEQFYGLEKYARAQGVKVYNLSPESYVDVFEKKTEFQITN